ncbi:MAG: hypothetical protein JJE19_04265 [Methanosarcinales archaeon]|nr:hypothetical protein [Methanosarcinales archaeon]
MTTQKIDEAVEWYKENRPKYEILAKKVKEILRENLDITRITYLDVTNRTKTVDSFKKKVLAKKYEDPINENKDYAGVRVITYIDSEAQKALAIINNLFDIDPEQTIDKSEELGTDRVGYRSIQTVAKFLDDRCKIPEFKRLKGMYFEIQIRTILQHAWAEIEHDRNYKFSGVLPKEIQRRFKILSGLLELADREFDDIAKSIDAYSETVAEKTSIGDLAIPINSTSLREYIHNKFASLIESGILEASDFVDDEIIEELEEYYGITSLDQLDEIVPHDLIENYLSMNQSLWYNGIIIDILIINNPEFYFEKAWKNKWGVTDPSDVPFFKKYGIDLRDLAKKYHFEIYNLNLTVNSI